MAREVLRPAHSYPRLLSSTAHSPHCGKFNSNIFRRKPICTDNADRRWRVSTDATALARRTDVSDASDVSSDTAVSPAIGLPFEVRMTSRLRASVDHTWLERPRRSLTVSNFIGHLMSDDSASNRHPIVQRFCFSQQSCYSVAGWPELRHSHHRG